MPKCRATGKDIPKKSSFSIKLNNQTRNTYFSSEEVYKEWVEEEKAKEEVIYEFNSVMGVHKFRNPSSIYRKKLTKWTEKEEYKYLEILEAIKMVKEVLIRHKRKGIPYLVQIIESNLEKSREVVKRRKLKSKIKLNIDAEDFRISCVGNLGSRKRDLSKYIL